MLPQDKFQLVERVTLLTLASQLNCLSTLGLGILDLGRGRQAHIRGSMWSWRNMTILLIFNCLVSINEVFIKLLQWQYRSDPLNFVEQSLQLKITFPFLQMTQPYDIFWHCAHGGADATMWSPRRRRFSRSTSLGTEFPSLFSLQGTGAAWEAMLGSRILTEPKWDNWYERCENVDVM